MAHTAASPIADATQAPMLTPEAFASSHLRVVLDAWPDAVYVVHAHALNFLYVNQAACRLRAESEDQYLQQKPWETLFITRDEMVQDHERLIAAPGVAESFEFLGTSMDGKRGWMELSRHAVHADGHWLVIAFMRNVTDRKLAEQAALRHQRMYAALSATNEAIMQARSASELYQRVCEAAVDSGGLISAAVLLPEGPDGLMRTEALASEGPSTVRDARISTDPATPEGRGLVGLACRSGVTQVSNDFMRDERTAYWHARARPTGVKSSAAVPLQRHGAVYGAMALFSRERRAFDDDVVKLLERMARNISFALENLERDRERHRTQSALIESEARFRALTHLSSDWYWEQDAELRYTRFESRVSGAAADIAGEFVGRQPWELAFEMEPGGGPSSFRAFLDEPQPFRDVVQMRPGSDGMRQYFNVSGEPLFDDSGRFTGYRGVSKDITSQRLADERIRYLATHDGLTGLPNRAMFSQLLNTEIELGVRNQRAFGLLYVDLDGFKRVNDTLGHDAGDLLLKAMAKRFIGAVRGSDTVSRLAGDEFAILVRDVHGAADLWAIASKVLAAAGAPLDVLGQTCEVSASIGMALFPEHARDELSLMKCADMAMYLAKRSGKNRARICGE